MAGRRAGGFNAVLLIRLMAFSRLSITVSLNTLQPSQRMIGLTRPEVPDTHPRPSHLTFTRHTCCNPQVQTSP